MLARALIKSQSLDSSELAQRVGIDEIAESMMAFNTNYKDTGLFGVYAVAKVWRFFLFSYYLEKCSFSIVEQGMEKVQVTLE